MDRKLRKLVTEMLNAYGETMTANYIYEAHCGRLDTAGPIINTANMHLFRRYRNNVNANAKVMIADALTTDKEET